MTLPELCGCVFSFIGVVAGIFTPYYFGLEWWAYLVGISCGFLVGWIIGVVISFPLDAVIAKSVQSDSADRKIED